MRPALSLYCFFCQSERAVHCFAKSDSICPGFVACCSVTNKFQPDTRFRPLLLTAKLFFDTSLLCEAIKNEKKQGKN